MTDVGVCISKKENKKWKLSETFRDLLAKWKIYPILCLGGVNLDLQPQVKSCIKRPLPGFYESTLDHSNEDQF